ncbi:hypothetical protein JCM8097_007706 [Rhodosporidiobolus ruineniae]
MSQSTTGPCLVCGEETTSRCEACCQAGIDLFFCSREHQKLVWYAHKLVCGPGKANPFFWPELSRDESKEAIDNLHTPVMSGTTGPKSLEDRLTAILPDCAGSIPATIRSLTSGLGHGAVPPFGRTRLGQQILLRIRLSEGARMRTSFSNVNPLSLLRAASTAAIGFSTPLSGELDGPLPVYHALLCHKLLVLIAVAQRGIHQHSLIPVFALGVDRIRQLLADTVEPGRIRPLAQLLDAWSMVLESLAS